MHNRKEIFKNLSFTWTISLYVCTILSVRSLNNFSAFIESHVAHCTCFFTLQDVSVHSTLALSTPLHRPSIFFIYPIMPSKMALTRRNMGSSCPLVLSTVRDQRMQNEMSN